MTDFYHLRRYKCYRKLFTRSRAQIGRINAYSRNSEKNCRFICENIFLFEISIDNHYPLKIERVLYIICTYIICVVFRVATKRQEGRYTVAQNEFRRYITNILVTVIARIIGVSKTMDTSMIV